MTDARHCAPTAAGALRSNPFHLFDCTDSSHRSSSPRFSPPEVSMPSRIVDVNGRWFEALRTTTQQPNLVPSSVCSIEIRSRAGLPANETAETTHVHNHFNVVQIAIDV